MKNSNKIFLFISFIILMAGCSILSMSAVASEYRYTWVAANPWNGVEGIVYTVRYFLHIGETSGWIISSMLLLIVWWRIYALIKRTFGG